MSRNEISQALREIFAGIARLKSAFPNRAFTIDGRLVGDIGEVIAALEYDVALDVKSRPKHDARTSDGHDVQIKATFKAQLTMRSVPDYYLGFQLFQDGRIHRRALFASQGNRRVPAVIPRKRTSQTVRSGLAGRTRRTSR